MAAMKATNFQFVCDISGEVIDQETPKLPDGWTRVEGTMFVPDTDNAYDFLWTLCPTCTETWRNKIKELNLNVGPTDEELAAAKAKKEKK